MKFSSFSVEDLKAINRRAIERLRAEESLKPSADTQPSADKRSGTYVSTHNPVGRAPAQEHTMRRIPGLRRLNTSLFADSPSATFSASDIRSAFILAKKKLSETD